MATGYRDYYAALGLKKGASAAEIKQAYRRLARQHHPDLHLEKDKAAQAEKFKAINEAYEVLSDPAKKATYEQLGPDWEGAQESRRGPRARGGDEAFSGFSDFFGDIFGSRGGGTRAGPPGAGQDVEAELPLSLEDAFRGGEKRFSIGAAALCAACGGTGRKGRGFCPTCGGVGEVQIPRTVDVKLPKHIRDGARLRLRGQGALGTDGRRGDLFLTVRLLPHPDYKVLGDDLETAVTVMPWVAALGGEASVRNLEGSVRIRIPAHTHAGRRLRIAGHGLSRSAGSRGDLYAVVRIDIPETLDPRLERLFKEMKEASA